MILFPLYFVLGFYLFAWQVWVYFLAVMRMQEVRDANKITKGSKPFAYQTLAVAYLMDFTLNMLASVIFLEWPKELLLSARVSRHIKDADSTGKLATWRKKISRWICSQLLDPYDPSGCHCK